MRARFIVAAVLLQFLVLAWMAGEREWVRQTGHIVYLRTMPVDPQDYFRGDYVHLNYEISSIGKNLWRDGLNDRKADENVYRRHKQEARVYTALKVGDSGIAELQYVTDRKPKSDLFIRGRIQNTWGVSMQVLYGIEAYFVQQGKGLALEKEMVRADNINVPMEMETAISGSGIAVLKGYRWSPIGIGMTLNTATNQPTILISADIKLLNASQTDIAIVDLPGASAFTLESDFRRGWEPNEWRWVGAKPRMATADEHVKALKPGEIYNVHINFNDPAWFVVKDGEKPKSFSNLGNNAGNIRCRLVYRPPSKEECLNLKNASIIWHGSLASRAFNGDRID